MSFLKLEGSSTSLRLLKLASMMLSLSCNATRPLLFFRWMSRDESPSSRHHGRTWSMVSFNTNETALRQRIADLEAKVAALQHEEERTTIALAQSSIAIFDWQLGVRRIYVSPILQDMLGNGDEGIPDNIQSWLSHVHPEHRYRAEKEVREALVAFDWLKRPSSTQSHPH
jgi:PAS domain-containing protein